MNLAPRRQMLRLLEQTSNQGITFSRILLPTISCRADREDRLICFPFVPRFFKIWKFFCVQESQYFRVSADVMHEQLDLVELRM